MFLIYALIGAAGGLLAGLLGIGGGLVIVPALLWALPYRGLGAAVTPHAAIATSLATVIVTSTAAAYAQHRRGAVDWPLVRALAPGLALGALAGALGATGLAPGTLKTLVGLFALAVGVQMGLGLRITRQGRLPGIPGLLAVGAAIGALSAMVGVGGGTLTVPFLHWGRVAMRRAIATSSACGFPIAIAGSLGFTLGRSTQVGAIYWPAALWIAGASIVFAPLGVRLSHRVPNLWLTRGFSLLLAIVAMRLILG